MAFPVHVHSAIPDDDSASWPIQQQGVNECGCTAPANAINLLLGRRAYEKDAFVRAAGIWFRRNIFGGAGGTPSFVTGWLIRKHGFGTHFGSLKQTNAEAVLRALLDRSIPIVVELGANRIGPLTLWGQHSVVLVGYSDPYTDAQGQKHEEYYFVDAQYPGLGSGFGLETNDADRDGDSIIEHYPGNRSIDRTTFLRDYPTGIYFPVFPSQAEHDAWAAAHLTTAPRWPVLGVLNDTLFTGTLDLWRGRS